MLVRRCAINYRCAGVRGIDLAPGGINLDY
jgi:hypothetical protein